MDFFVDNGVEKFSPADQRRPANACEPWRVRPLKDCFPVDFEPTRVARRVGQPHIRKCRVRCNDMVDPCLRMLIPATNSGPWNLKPVMLIWTAAIVVGFITGGIGSTIQTAP